MLEGVFGNATAGKVLLYLEQYGEGYAKGIADHFDVSLSMVQRQLERLERASLLVSLFKGRTRLFSWNPHCDFIEELRGLLVKALQSLPEEERQRYFTGPHRSLRS